MKVLLCNKLIYIISYWNLLIFLIRASVPLHCEVKALNTRLPGRPERKTNDHKNQLFHPWILISGARASRYDWTFWPSLQASSSGAMIISHSPALKQSGNAVAAN